ncbi:hypothetical protein TNIN_70281, partial [Trichonephila inaurata madagascariensis]
DNSGIESHVIVPADDIAPFHDQCGPQKTVELVINSMIISKISP